MSDHGNWVLVVLGCVSAFASGVRPALADPAPLHFTVGERSNADLHAQILVEKVYGGSSPDYPFQWYLHSVAEGLRVRQKTTPGSSAAELVLPEMNQLLSRAKSESGELRTMLNQQQEGALEPAFGTITGQYKAMAATMGILGKSGGVASSSASAFGPILKFARDHDPRVKAEYEMASQDLAAAMAGDQFSRYQAQADAFEVSNAMAENPDFSRRLVVEAPQMAGLSPQTPRPELIAASAFLKSDENRDRIDKLEADLEAKDDSAPDHKVSRQDAQEVETYLARRLKEDQQAEIQRSQKEQAALEADVLTLSPSEREKRQAAREALLRESDARLEQMQDGLRLGAAVVGRWDKEGARLLYGAGSGAIKLSQIVIHAPDEWAKKVTGLGKAATVGMITLNALDVISSVVGLFGGGPSTEDLILEQVQMLGRQLADFAEDTQRRLDAMDGMLHQTLRITYDTLRGVNSIRDATDQLREGQHRIEGQLQALRKSIVDRFFGEFILSDYHSDVTNACFNWNAFHLPEEFIGDTLRSCHKSIIDFVFKASTVVANAGPRSGLFDPGTEDVGVEWDLNFTPLVKFAGGADLTNQALWKIFSVDYLRLVHLHPELQAKNVFHDGVELLIKPGEKLALEAPKVFGARDASGRYELLQRLLDPAPPARGYHAVVSEFWAELRDLAKDLVDGKFYLAPVAEFAFDVNTSDDFIIKSQAREFPLDGLNGEMKWTACPDYSGRIAADDPSDPAAIFRMLDAHPVPGELVQRMVPFEFRAAQALGLGKVLFCAKREFTELEAHMTEAQPTGKGLFHYTVRLRMRVLARFQDNSGKTVNVAEAIWTDPRKGDYANVWQDHDDPEGNNLERIGHPVDNQIGWIGPNDAAYGVGNEYAYYQTNWTGGFNIAHQIAEGLRTHPHNYSVSAYSYGIGAVRAAVNQEIAKRARSFLDQSFAALAYPEPIVPPFARDDRGDTKTGWIRLVSLYREIRAARALFESYVRIGLPASYAEPAFAQWVRAKPEGLGAFSIGSPDPTLIGRAADPIAAAGDEMHRAANEARSRIETLLNANPAHVGESDPEVLAILLELKQLQDDVSPVKK